MYLGVLVLISVGMLGMPDGAATPRSEYEAMASKAGRDPDAHAQLALWCEAHGLDPERAKHLGMAVLTDPKHALARSLLGLVQDGGKWRRPEQIVSRNANDPERQALLEEYHAKRAVVGNSADAQAKLGAWCESRGLTVESQAHYAMALRLDPNRADIWKKLGYSKHKGEWRTDAMIAAEKAEAKAQEEADRRWSKQLQTWKEMLGQTEGRRREAEAGLATVDDPRAVGSVLKVFAKDNPALAVRLLGQIDAAAASRALAMAAVFAKSSEVRRAAAETLTQRDPREYAGYLISLIRDPIRYEVKPVGGPGSPGELWVEGKKADLKRVYAPPPPPQVALMPGDQLGYDAFGLPVIRRYREYADQAAAFYTFTLHTDPAVMERARNFVGTLGQDPNLSPAAGPLGQWLTNLSQQDPLERLWWDLSQQEPSFRLSLPPGFEKFRRTGPSRGGDPTYSWGGRGVTTVQENFHVGQAMVAAQQTAALAQRRLQADVAQLEGYNRSLNLLNDRIVPILASVSGQDFGPKREAWDEWLTDQVGYATYRKNTYKPTIVQNVPLGQPSPVPVSVSMGRYLRASCFAAGTLVWTQSGYRAIETLEVGDRVLSQDTTTGSQSYQPVLVVHRNPPSKTLRVSFEGGESVTASTYHRFWKANQGWVMARELKPGDTLRTQSGLVRVSGIQEEPEQPVFNLDVAHSHSFFVGTLGALVHDNSLPDTRLTPFDRLPEIAQHAP